MTLFTTGTDPFYQRQFGRRTELRDWVGFSHVAVVPRPAPKVFDAPTTGEVTRIARLGDPLPAPVAEALGAYRQTAGGTFDPPAQVAKLGVPSLIAEARNEWRKAHRERCRVAWKAVLHAVRDAAVGQYANCAADLAAAIEAVDEPRFAAAVARGREWRGRLPDLLMVTRSGRPDRQPLDALAPEWLVGAMGEWHRAGQPPITAQVAHDHPDLGIALRTPAEVAELHREA